MRCRLLVPLAALALSACGGGSTSRDRGDDPRAGKTGGTLTMLWAYDAQQVDCGATYYTVDWMLCWSTQRPLYNYRPEDGARMVPDLAAAKPEVSPDGRTVTVRIRSGVRFSPPVKRAVTARDVKYAIERGFFKTVNNGYAEAYFGALIGARPGAEPGSRIRGLETPDDRTLVLRLRQPTGGALAAGALALPLTAPVPEEYARAFDARNPSLYGRHQVATGPYMIANDAAGKAVGYEPGRRIRLVRNPSWDRSTDYKPAYLDEIDHRTDNTDTSIAARRVLGGSAMATADFQPPAPILKEALTERPRQLTTTPGSGTRWIAMNTTIEPFHDLDVRKAVIAGFDRAALRLVLGGPTAGGLATHFLPPSDAGFEAAGGETGPGLDFLNASGKPMPGVSAAYFRKAGYTSGRYTGSQTVHMVGSNAGDDARIAEVAKQSLERMGFKVRMRLVSYETLTSRFCGVPAAEVAICPNFGWVADFSDGQAMLHPTFRGDNRLEVGNVNLSRLDVGAIDAAMDRAVLLTEPEERARAWARIDRAITEQAPAVPWLWDNGIVLASADVQMAVNRANGGLPDLAHTALR